jgi:GT2 family glycosyltransferase
VLTLDVLIITFNRSTEVLNAIESCKHSAIDKILVLDNGSSNPITPNPNFILHRSKENLGPCAGRNTLASKSSADLLLFLDDDALLAPSSDLDSVINDFLVDPDLAVVAGLVQREDGNIERSEFPTRRVHRIDNKRPVGYFVEGACIIRKSVFTDFAGYDPNFFYGHEASDLALRLASKNQLIFYNPKLCLIHKPSNSGRERTNLRYVELLRNRRVLCWRNLPRLISFIHCVIWFGFYSKKVLQQTPQDFRRLVKAAITPIQEHEQLINQSRHSFSRCLKLQRRGFRVFW